MWRRLRPIPLTNKPERPDPSLKTYLADPDGALPAVLAWGVEGAMKYLNSSAIDPLGWCTAVKEAHDGYRKNEDRIGAFLEEETVSAEGKTIKLTLVYGLYKGWSEIRGERALTQIAFQRKLLDRGIEILGNGNRALLKNIDRAIQEVSSVDQVDFNLLARFNY
jgi:putative DNA primase/helicase